VENKAYIIAGSLGDKFDCRQNLMFDLSTHQYKLCAAALTDRTIAVGTAVNHNIYLPGGRKLKGIGIVEKYNVHKDKWKQLASMKISRRSHAVVSTSQYIYALGGRTPSKSGLTAAVIVRDILILKSNSPNIERNM
jgi:hypothetical protein